jgi:tRNA1(Val) A37 N6-methylase TrmN6
MAFEGVATSEDAVLGGRLILRQPRRGHRFGHDAILLAAAAAASAGEHAVDLGAGVGIAGLALARRVAGLAVTLLEIDPVLANLAKQNAERNGLADRVRAVCLDVAAPVADFAAAGLAAGSAHGVLMNPPFNAAANPSPEARRSLAHSAAHDTSRQWTRTASRLLRANGVLTLIWRADGLGEVLDVLASDFGAMALLPVHPKPAAPAVRVLVRAVKASRAPLRLLPGLLLADADGKPSEAAEAVLRGGAVLPLAAAS